MTTIVDTFFTTTEPKKKATTTIVDTFFTTTKPKKKKREGAYLQPPYVVTFGFHFKHIVVAPA
jgi:hypothetical protein